ncbi:transposase, partial [Lactococcus cremoris]
ITPVRKNMKQKKILFPNFSKRRKVIERVFSFLTNLGAERCKSRSPRGFQLKLEMILLAYSLLLKSAKSLEPETLRYSIGYQVMAK